MKRKSRERAALDRMAAETPEKVLAELRAAREADEAMLAELLNAARAHGEAGDPDHEVGDLQEIIRACWSYLSEHSKMHVRKDLEHLRVWGGK